MNHVVFWLRISGGKKENAREFDPVFTNSPCVSLGFSFLSNKFLSQHKTLTFIRPHTYQSCLNKQNLSESYQNDPFHLTNISTNLLSSKYIYLSAVYKFWWERERERERTWKRCLLSRSYRGVTVGGGLTAVGNSRQICPFSAVRFEN